MPPGELNQLWKPKQWRAHWVEDEQPGERGGGAGGHQHHCLHRHLHHRHHHALGHGCGLPLPLWWVHTHQNLTAEKGIYLLPCLSNVGPMKENLPDIHFFQLILNLALLFAGNPFVAAPSFIISHFLDGKAWSSKLIWFKFNEASFAIFDAIWLWEKFEHIRKVQLNFRGFSLLPFDQIVSYTIVWI